MWLNVNDRVSPTGHPVCRSSDASWFLTVNRWLRILFFSVLLDQVDIRSHLQSSPQHHHTCKFRLAPVTVRWARWGKAFESHTWRSHRHQPSYLAFRWCAMAYLPYPLIPNHTKYQHTIAIPYISTIILGFQMMCNGLPYRVIPNHTIFQQLCLYMKYHDKPYHQHHHTCRWPHDSHPWRTLHCIFCTLGSTTIDNGLVGSG